jgi:NitT/TauT family transport system substrate-binding protein
MKVILQSDWYPQPEHGGFYTAQLKGYYRDEGLEVEIRPGGPYVSVDQQVAVGGAQFGLGASDKTLESVAAGQGEVAVAATMQRDPQGIMVRKSSRVRSFEDLNHRQVAVKPGSTWFRYLVKRYQLNDVREIPATMSVANFVADPDYIQQAFATSEPFFVKRAGIETRILLTSDAGYAPYRVIFTNQSFLRQHRETVAKFVRASLRGWQEYLRDPSVAHAEIVKLNPAIDSDWLRFSWQALRDGHFITSDAPGERLGGMDAARWNTMYRQLLDLGVIDRPLDPSLAYTLQFVGAN